MIAGNNVEEILYGQSITKMSLDLFLWSLLNVEKIDL